jgi:predicted nuclease of predicted toxin-antitoxin system
MLIKFLADVNIEKKIVDCLFSHGFDVKWIPDYNCSMEDAALLDLANNENRILLTNDKDFGDLIFLQKKISLGIILFRVKGEKTKEKIELLEKLISNHKEMIAHHFIVITRNKFRFIPMEDII